MIINSYKGAMNNSIAVYTTIYKLVYQDIADCYQLPQHIIARDLREIEDRVFSEGLSFLTKTMPLFGKRLDKALTGSAKFDCTGLELDQIGMPKWCSFLFERVFAADPSDRGHLLLREEPDVDAIRYLRQLAYYMYKLELDHDKTTINAVIDGFVEVDQSLPSLAEVDPVVEAILKSAKQLVTNVMGCFDHRDIIPRHGPGSVATGEANERKFAFRRIFRSLEREYPFTEYFCSGINHVADELAGFSRLKVHETPTAKVTLVPKDSRGPRLISMEPLEVQWIQQGLARKMMRQIENHRLTRGFVNFTKQSINRDLALLGSKDQRWATLDMKEASDRVSLELVTKLFADCPCLDGFIACRSTHTALPDGRKIELKKFAPMGSALCFPVESLLFWALSVSTIMHVTDTKRKVALRSVYVYGDDIVIAAPMVEAVMQYLPKVGLLFNLDKCCSSGFFRESCGCDAYKGVDVTPVRLRKPLLPRVDINSQQGARLLASTVAQSNRLHDRGYYRTADYLRYWVEAILGPLPVVEVLTREPGLTTGLLAWLRPGLCHLDYRPHKLRWNHPDKDGTRLQQWEVKGWRLVAPNYRSYSNSWRSVLAWMSNPRAEQPTDAFANSSRIQLKNEWTLLR